MVNDRLWWDNYFRTGAWERAKGKAQTEYFARMIIENLPDDVLADLCAPGITILDWGCALGQGVDAYQFTFKNAIVTGLDFSAVAIEKAREIYPDYKFRAYQLSPDEMYDVIIVSNVLEHFHEPLAVVKKHMFNTMRYYIILVPYNQYGKDGPYNDGCHLYSFKEKAFPGAIHGFVRRFMKVIPPQRSELWAGDQLLIVYERG